MNGVVGRGGAYNSAIDRFRCARRNGTRNKGYLDIELNGGFRCEWCAKGWVCKYIRLCVS